MNWEREFPTFANAKRPYCAKCGGGKLVDKMAVERSMLRMTYQFVVWCHGEEERCELTEELIAFSTGVDRGYAFLPKPELPEPQKRLGDGKVNDGGI